VLGDWVLGDWVLGVAVLGVAVLAVAVLGDGAGAGLGSVDGREREATAEVALVTEVATFEAVAAASETLPTSPRSRACSTASVPLRAA
jgi:hypothetical protein